MKPRKGGSGRGRPTGAAPAGMEVCDMAKRILVAVIFTPALLAVMLVPAPLALAAAVSSSHLTLPPERTAEVFVGAASLRENDVGYVCIM